MKRNNRSDAYIIFFIFIILVSPLILGKVMDVQIPMQATQTVEAHENLDNNGAGRKKSTTSKEMKIGNVIYRIDHIDGYKILKIDVLYGRYYQFINLGKIDEEFLAERN